MALRGFFVIVSGKNVFLYFKFVLTFSKFDNLRNLSCMWLPERGIDDKIH